MTNVGMVHHGNHRSERLRGQMARAAVVTKCDNRTERPETIQERENGVVEYRC